ncbi:MAG: molybdate ABC transporter substrate-binding protein [Nocardioidaceae bacterium]
MRRIAGLVAGIASIGSLGACGSNSGATGAAGSETLTVYAASSLTSALTQIGKDFESSHPGVTVRFSFGGSSDLVAQLEQGAPADVFASADTANMDKATSANLVEGKPVSFASNTLQIAVPPDNPAAISSFADLSKPNVKLVICAAEVPCGAAARQVAMVAGQKLTPVSEEQSVTDVLAKVESGEADAGLVYVTDVLAAGSKVKGITFPESGQVVNTYPIATLSNSADTSLAQQFVDQVTGPVGQKVLAGFGFAKP